MVLSIRGARTIRAVTSSQQALSGDVNRCASPLMGGRLMQYAVVGQEVFVKGNVKDTARY